MKTFLVAYRFDDSSKGKGRERGPLWRAIESLGAFALPMESVWIVCTMQTIQQVHDRLSPYFDDSDRLLIVECGQAAEWKGIPVDTAVWLGHEFNAQRHEMVKRHRT